MNTITPVQRQGILMTFASNCVSCLKPAHMLWDADGFALNDESTSDGFCNPCWNY